MNNTASTIAAARHSGIKLDEVPCHSRGLTSTQVSALYNFGKEISETSEILRPSHQKLAELKVLRYPQLLLRLFPNPYYEAVNLTPRLSINNTIGEISGTPTVGGVGSITVIARNAAGKRAVATIPYDSNPTGPAYSSPTLPPCIRPCGHPWRNHALRRRGKMWSTLSGHKMPQKWELSSMTWVVYQARTPTDIKITYQVGLASTSFGWNAEDNTTITHSSNAVSQWNDKSGNGNHATQATSSRMPTYTVSNSLLNNKPSVSSASQNGSIGLEPKYFSSGNLCGRLLQGVVQTQHLTITTPKISGPGPSGKYRSRVVGLEVVFFQHQYI